MWSGSVEYGGQEGYPQPFPRFTLPPALPHIAPPGTAAAHSVPVAALRRDRPPTGAMGVGGDGVVVGAACLHCCGRHPQKQSKPFSIQLVGSWQCRPRQRINNTTTM